MSALVLQTYASSLSTPTEMTREQRQEALLDALLTAGRDFVEGKAGDVGGLAHVDVLLAALDRGMKQLAQDVAGLDADQASLADRVTALETEVGNLLREITDRQLGQV